MSPLIKLVGTIILWYAASTGYNVLTKVLVRSVKLDVLFLGLVHTSVGMTFLLFSENPNTTSSSSSKSSPSRPSKSLQQAASPLTSPSHSVTITTISESVPTFNKYFADIIMTALFHTIGNLFTLYSLTLLSVPLVLTVKATEPIFAMFLLKCLNLQEANLNILKGLAVLIMVAGTLLATVKEVEFEIMAFLSAVTANFGFQLRNIYAKYTSKISIKCGYNYGLISMCSFVLIATVLSGKFLWTWVPLWRLGTQYDSILESIISNQNMDPQKIIILVLLSGICHSSYNFFSLGVLSFVSPVTHSVLNTLKRLFIIWISIMCFSSPVTFVGLLGSLMVIAGSLGYGYAVNTSK